MKDARFAVFAVLYAAAVVLDHAQEATRLGPNVGTLSLVLGLGVLVAPRSLACFALFAAAHAAFLLSELPPTANLGLVHFAVCTTTLLGLAALAVARRGRVAGGELLDAVAPALRLELVVVYVWSFWHKLNVDFLDPELSCALGLYEKVRWSLSFLPLPESSAIAGFLIGSTLAIEGGLPVLLLLRRTRGAAVAIGLLFHLALGFGYFYAFSSACIALLVLFLSERFVRRVAERLRALGFSMRAWRIGVAVLLVAVAIARVQYGWHGDRTVAANLAGIDVLGNHFALKLWWLYVPPVLVGALAALSRSEASARELVRSRPAFLLAVPLVLLVNGASPYLGFKTEYSFAMYSNLRTEGGRSNHLVITAPLDLVDYQRDLVRVLDSSNADLQAVARSPFPIPFLDLRNRIDAARRASAGDFSLVYARDGRRHEVPSVAAAPEFATRPTFFERMQTFRLVRYGDNGCSH